MKTLNQKKKELFELLHEYFSMKPSESFIEEFRNHTSGRHCALGFLDEDFNHTKRISSMKHNIYENRVTGCVLRLTEEGRGYSHGYGIVMANNNWGKYADSSLNAKQRVLKYLKNQINKLS